MIARIEDGCVVIEHDDGSAETRSGGTRAWRNNNPGNIRAGDWCARHGAIGSDGAFAIFPDEAAGEAALRAELSGPGYAALSIDAAIARRSPPTDDNDTEGLKTMIAEISGLPGDAIVGHLEPDQLQSLCAAIRRTEGWQPGTVTAAA